MPIIPGYGIRVTMFFEDGNTGWTETHYATQQTTLTGAVNAVAGQVVVARQQLLANGPWLKYLRASRDGVFRDAQVVFIAAPPTSRITGQYINNQEWAQVSSAVQWTTALMRGVGGDFYRRQLYISGVPYTDPTDVGNPQQDAVLNQAAQAYAGILSNGGYGFPVWTRDPALQVPVAITGIALVGGVYQFTAAAPHGLPENFNPTQTTWRAFLHGMRFQPTPGTIKRPAPSPNGGYTFTYISNTVFALPTWIFPGPNLTANYTYIPGSGTVQAQQRAIATYQLQGGVILERFTHRKRGRPFDAPVGKSRARKIFALA